jgi:hypothetical protein
MLRTTFFTALLAATCWSLSTSAITLQQMTEEERSAIVGNWKPLAVTGNALPWELFSKTKEISTRRNFPDGSYTFDISPGYSTELKKFSGTQVTLMGFMFPLEESDKQHNFLLGPYPMSCPFHYHVGPSQIVEVIMKNKEKIDFSFDPVTLKGNLATRHNKETGVFYYLEEAELK